MKSNLFKLFSLMVALLIGGGSMVINAAAVSIPMQVGEYIDITRGTTDKSVELNSKYAKTESSDVYAIGSTHKGGVGMTVHFDNKEAGDYILSFYSGSKNGDAKVKITLNNAVYTFDIPKTGAWTRTTYHAVEVKNLPVGTFDMKFEVTEEVSYGGNFGFFNIAKVDDYANNMASVNLKGGVYSTMRVEDAGNVGYCSNKATAQYTMYNKVAGLATMNIGLKHINDGTLKLTVTDAFTGKQELTKDLAITQDICHGYDTPTSFEIGNLSQGLKNIKFEVSTEASFLCNYKNLGFTVAPQAIVGETGFATIGFPCAVTLPEGIKAYAITSVNDNTVTLSQVNSTAVAANTGLIICAKPDTYTFAQATEGDEVTDNKLVANTEGDKVAEAEKDFYVLGVTDATKKTVGMMPIAANGTVGQYKAYLPATAVTSLAKGLKIVFDNQTTAISEVEANAAETTNNAAYNMLGQRVNGNAKGIIIVNGKKYIK